MGWKSLKGTEAIKHKKYCIFQINVLTFVVSDITAWIKGPSNKLVLSNIITISFLFFLIFGMVQFNFYTEFSRFTNYLDLFNTWCFFLCTLQNGISKKLSSKKNVSLIQMIFKVRSSSLLRNKKQSL